LQSNRPTFQPIGRARRWPASFEELGAFLPSLDVSETEGAMEISAELPGMTEKDIDVTLSPDRSTVTINGVLTIQLEKDKVGNGEKHIKVKTA
jgi:HSP20 family protein